VDGRITGQHGIDFSWAEAKLGLGAGKTVKFRGSTEYTTMGYYNATYGGVAFVSLAMTNKETGGGDAGSRVVSILGYPTGVVEIDKGALNVIMDRILGKSVTTAGWGGAPDTASRFQVYNRAAHLTQLLGIRAGYFYARQYSGGNCSNIYGLEVSADDRGSYGAGTPGYSVSDMRSMIITFRANGVIPAAGVANVLHIQDNSQGSIQANTYAGSAMFKIESAQVIATGARLTGIHFHTSGSGSGWTNAFSFQTAAGKEGYTAIADGDLKGKVNGYIKVYDVATGQTLYINCYDTVPST
jgi:hypothetical protein